MAHPILRLVVITHYAGMRKRAMAHPISITSARANAPATIRVYRHVTGCVHWTVQHVVRHGDDNMAGEPFHPGRSFVFPKKKFGKRERSCQFQWFVDYPFLHYDVEKDVVLCHTCVTAIQQHGALFS